MKLVALAQELYSKKPILAYRVFAASLEGGEVVRMLQDLLKKEYHQRDLYQAYDYLLLGHESISLQEHLQEHMAEEMEHIRTLHRYLTNLGELPTLQRDPIEDLSKTGNLNVKGILSIDLVHEKDAVDSYTKAIRFLERSAPEFTALRVDLENILSMEMEHVHDLERYLAAYENSASQAVSV